MKDNDKEQDPGTSVQRKIRRTDRALADGEAREILRNGEYGVLSTVSEDGRPYGVPVNYSYTGEAVYFHCALEGHKLDNLRANSKVSFCVVGKTEVLPEKFATRYESVILFGSATEATAGEKQTALTELVKKYSSAYLQEGLEYINKVGSKARVYRITIESLTGKARK